MSLSIVVAQDESGKVACLHASLDADKALVAYRNDKLLEAAKLNGNLKVMMFRRPMHFKRREVLRAVKDLKA